MIIIAKVDNFFKIFCIKRIFLQSIGGFQKLADKLSSIKINFIVPFNFEKISLPN